MKRLVMTLALTCVLASSALAGDIPTDGSASPLPGQTTQTKPSTSPGDIPSVPGDTPCGDAYLSTDALLTLLSVLGFLAV